MKRDRNFRKFISGVVKQIRIVYSLEDFNRKRIKYRFFLYPRVLATL